MDSAAMTPGRCIKVTEYLCFEEAPPHAKTRVVRVVSRSQGRTLGEISWFGRWRQYCFSPNAETVFNAGCLEDIKAVCEEMMKEWRGTHG